MALGSTARVDHCSGRRRGRGAGATAPPPRTPARPAHRSAPAPPPGRGPGPEPAVGARRGPDWQFECLDLALGVGDGDDQHHQGDAGDGVAGAAGLGPHGAPAEGDDGRQDQQADQVHDLDQRVEGRAGGVLERVADGVADDRRLVGLGALAALVAVLDVLLGVVPRPAGVGQEVGHQLAGEDDRGQERAEGQVADAEADDDRGQHGQQGRRGQLPQRGGGADVDDPPVVGLLGVVHDPGVLPELAAHLLDHRARRCGRRPGWRASENRKAIEPPISRPMKVFGSATLIWVTGRWNRPSRSGAGSGRTGPGRRSSR